MALNNIEDRLECAIAHINTSVDIDPWAQKLAVESMRMRIALMKGGRPEIVYCRDCKHHWTHSCMDAFPREICDLDQTFYDSNFDYCSLGERRTDGVDS